MFNKVLTVMGFKKQDRRRRALLVLTFFVMVGMIFTGCGKKKGLPHRYLVR